MLQKVKDIYSESIQIQISASSLLSENIATAAQMVMQCLLSGNKVIALTGANNDAIQGVLAEADLEISIPATKEARILENHLFVINALSELVDSTLFPRA